jgi:hypothetical protein
MGILPMRSTAILAVVLQDKVKKAATGKMPVPRFGETVVMAQEHEEKLRKPGLTRRELFGLGGRLFGLAAAGAIVARLAGRRIMGSAAGAPSAPAASRCARCNVFEGCQLPEADLARRQGLGLVGPVRRPIPGRPTAPAAPLCGQSRGVV